jgi:2-isopropylmalate synthase
MHSVKIYDTTLRDGAQAEDIAFSLDDKLRIARQLDELGIHYIEGGYPGSNPKDAQFFKVISREPMRVSKITAFGMTQRAGSKAREDLNIKAILNSGAEVAAVVGKSWDLHVREVLRVTLEENLKSIFNSLSYLKKRMGEVVYDAEHFFEGYRANPEYALKTIKAAEEAGADWIVLCDTNGGVLPSEVRRIVEELKQKVRVPLGIHAHNDCGLAVANSLVAVEAGARQVHGTINGYGERCGNADLCSLLPNLAIKLKVNCIPPAKLRRLREVSRFVNELANLVPNKHQPFVGDSAFAHKGGIHISAIQRNPQTYEHINPERVGNKRRVLISDLSGKSSVLFKAKEFGIDLKSKDRTTLAILDNLKSLESQGFQFEGAEASFEILMKKALKKEKKFFRLLGFRVIDEKREEGRPPYSEATIMVEVGGRIEHTAAVGNGPVNALDNALRKALEKFYPELKEVELKDFKVRVLTTGEGTAAEVRVLVESGDKHDRWGTVGVSHNIIEASWQALVDSIDYKLLKGTQKAKKTGREKKSFDRK